VSSSTCFSACTFPADVVDTCAVLSRATTCSEVSSMAHVRSPVAAQPKLSRQLQVRDSVSPPPAHTTHLHNLYPLHPETRRLTPPSQLSHSSTRI